MLQSINQSSNTGIDECSSELSDFIDAALHALHASLDLLREHADLARELLLLGSSSLLLIGNQLAEVVGPLLEASLQSGDLTFNDVADLVDVVFKLVSVIIGVVLGGHDVDERVVGFELGGVGADVRDVVGEQGQLHLARVLLVAGAHLVKSVAHDGNQHVQGSDKREEGCA